MSGHKVYLRGVNLDLIKDDEEPAKIKPDVNSNFKIPDKYKWDISHPKEMCLIINKYQQHGGVINSNERSEGRIRCMYTLEPISGIPIGIPIAKEGNNYFCIDAFSTFNDALAELVCRRLYQPNRYEQSETLLHEIFQIYYPGHKLKPSPDKRLLRIFNGPMSIEEFREFSYFVDKVKEEIKLIPLRNTLTYTRKEI